MRATIVPLADLSAARVEQWRRLAADALEPNPFSEPELVLPAARYLGCPPAGLLVVDADGELVLCAPVMTQPRWRRMVPVPVLASWHHDYCSLETPLVGRREPVGAWQAVLEHGASARGGATLLMIDELGAGGTVERAMNEAASAGGTAVGTYRSSDRALMERGAGGDRLQIGVNHRKALRRHQRRLAGDLGGPLRVVDTGGDTEAIEAFLALEAAGWKGAAGTAMATRPGHADFFREMCRGFAATGRLHMLALAGDRGVAAMQCNVRSGDTIFCLKVAYDEAHARSSPGLQLELAAASWFIDDTAAARMDSCAEPHNEMLNRLWPRRRAVKGIVLGSGSTGRALA
ncbi:MAG: hypothetical protein QOG64_3241, partial [Acidimicrobiaceae bacterium]|nr:hypothetical protein [Acidimicrobiaceae bacterium]